jgi:hypothetical protein
MAEDTETGIEADAKVQKDTAEEAPKRRRKAPSRKSEERIEAAE